jgi:hypothetical protein
MLADWCGKAGDRGARGRPPLTAAAALLLSACVVSNGVKVEPLPREPVSVKSPVKAHLKDGSTVVFAEGATVGGGLVRGKGVRHDLALKASQPVGEIPLDQVVAMERFRDDVDGTSSVLLTLLATAAGVAATGALAVAIFGSCPTVYSNPGRSPQLEAETFSHSIASLFEDRDLDRLSVDAGPDASLRLEIRNEALETHYINHLQLLEVRHDDSETVVPDQAGAALVVGSRSPALTARSRAGLDVKGAIAEADEDSFRTNAETLAAARAGDLEDWIDLAFPAPAGTDQAALVLRARSSLLNTVLFYDVMLADAGPRALDWLGDLERISHAVELGRFVRKYMGLRVLEWRDGELRELARIADPGPIAWHDVAVSVPVKPGQREIRLRLTFLADAWRIDAVALAQSARRETPRSLPVAEVTGSTGLLEPEALRSLRAPDNHYLQTSPGQRFFARFDPPPLARGERRTLLLSSQGYYSEWVRGDWLRAAHPPRVFVPGEDVLVDALGRWQRKQASLEARFETQRVPVL